MVMLRMADGVLAAFILLCPFLGHNSEKVVGSLFHLIAPIKIRSKLINIRSKLI